MYYSYTQMLLTIKKLRICFFLTKKGSKGAFLEYNNKLDYFNISRAITSF